MKGVFFLLNSHQQSLCIRRTIITCIHLVIRITIPHVVKLVKQSNVREQTFFSTIQQHNWCLWRLTVDVSRSHTDICDQPVAETTTYKISSTYALIGIRNCDPSNETAAVLRFRPQGHQDRLNSLLLLANNYICVPGGECAKCQLVQYVWVRAPVFAYAFTVRSLRKERDVHTQKC